MLCLHYNTESKHWVVRHNPTGVLLRLDQARVVVPYDLDVPHAPSEPFPAEIMVVHGLTIPTEAEHKLGPNALRALGIGLPARKYRRPRGAKILQLMPDGTVETEGGL